MKQILASLIAAYTLTNGQTVTPGTPAATPLATAGAIPVIPIANPIAPAAPLTTTAGTTTASGGSLPGTGGVSPPIAPPAVFPQPVPGSAATTTAAPGTTLPVVTPPQPPIGTPGVGVVSPPVNPVPVTPAPVTPAPVTPVPTTAAPTTAAPTMNQYCPLPAELGNTHGVQSGTAMSSNQGCISPHERAVAFNGILQCNSYACCQCAEIQCGDPMGLACDELVISDSGAVGNQNINVLGDMMSAFGGGSFAGIGGGMNNGAQIRCNGMEACKASKIYGKYVGTLDCAGDMGCAGANIRLEDPGNELQVQCNGMMTCMNTNLEIVITPQSQIFELGTIEFNGQQSAQGMTITIENQGYNPILLQNLECMNPTACPNLRINIIGQVFIENCDLQHMNIQTAGPSLLTACQAGNAFQGGGFNPGFPPQQFPPVQQPLPPVTPPQTPGQQPPVQPPATGVNPPAGPSPPVQQPPATGLPPINQPPINPGFGGNVGVGVIDPQSLTCEFGQCRNRAITMTPRQNFVLKCVQPMQCDGLSLTLNMGDAMAFAGFLPRIDTLTFSAPTNGATITINGYAEINDIRCEIAGACRNLKVNGAGIDIYSLNMDCQEPGSCIGCTINGQDCNQLAMMQGNTGGYGMGYYGQYSSPQYSQPAVPQQPIAPQQPQQPVVPQQPAAPQQPQQPQQPQYPQYQYPQYQYPQYQYPTYPQYYYPWI